MTSVAKDGPETIARLVGFQADVAQLVEHHLAKVRVAGSNPVVRSKKVLVRGLEMGPAPAQDPPQRAGVP